MKHVVWISQIFRLFIAKGAKQIQCSAGGVSDVILALLCRNIPYAIYANPKWRNGRGDIDGHKNKIGKDGHNDDNICTDGAVECASRAEQPRSDGFAAAKLRQSFARKPPK